MMIRYIFPYIHLSKCMTGIYIVDFKQSNKKSYLNIQKLLKDSMEQLTGSGRQSNLKNENHYSELL